MISTAHGSDPRVSVAIPVYNEEQNLAELLRRVGGVLDSLAGGPHEVVLVDDGSTDTTPALLEAAVRVDPRLVAIALSRNFGHQIALSAALDHVTGDLVVVLDGDLQDPPEVIPTLLHWHRQGYDVVYAQRRHRKEPWWLRLSYYAFYRLLALLSDTHIPVDAGDFCLMSARVVRQLRQAPERQRFIRGLRTWTGFRQIAVPVERAERFSGRSKYTARKLVRLALDGIFSFSVVPLRLATLIGAAAMLLTIAFAAYSLYAKLLLDRSPAGFTALILVITFISGVNLFFLGIIGEYIGRIYQEVKARPLYVLDRVMRHEEVTTPVLATAEVER